MAVDPVCGMTVNPDRAAGSVEYDGTTYYFCSKSCVAKFQADPKKYLSGAREPMHAPQMLTIGGLKKSPGPQSPKTEASVRLRSPESPSSFGETAFAARQAEAGGAREGWVCPMDPEVVSDRPGACPKCGMALEPRVADLSDAPNPELVDMTRRFWIGVALGAPVFLLTMGDMLSGGTLSHRIGMSTVNWLGFVLATPVVFWCGWPFFHRMWHSIVNASPNRFTFIGMGLGGGYIQSATIVGTGGRDTYSS